MSCRCRSQSLSGSSLVSLLSQSTLHFKGSLLGCILDSRGELVDTVAVVKELTFVAEFAVVDEDEVAALLAGFDVRHQAVSKPAALSEQALPIQKVRNTENS